MSDISWSFNFSIAGGPSLSSAQTMTVEAYDKIEVTIAGADKASPTKAKVDIQPGGAGKIRFLLITSNRYGADLKYGVTGGTKDIVLDASQLLIGAGAIGLLGAAPKTLDLANGLGVGNDAAITVIVGRDAVV